MSEEHEGYEKDVQLLFVGIGKDDTEGVMRVIEQEVEKFSAFLVEAKTDPLSRPESALLRTYLKYKHEVAF